MKKKEIMIDVDHVSMRFNLGIDKGFSLKQGFINIFNKEKRKQKKKSEFWALNDVEFKINKGEVVGFIGSNGAREVHFIKSCSRGYETNQREGTCIWKYLPYD